MPLATLKSALQSVGHTLKTARSTRRPGTTPTPSSPPPAKVTPLTQPALLTALHNALDDLKADNLVIVPLTGKTSLTDWLVIATGTSSRHLTSLADRVQDTLKAHHTPLLSREGDTGTDWVCVDAGDIIIHLFLPDARQRYNLEKLWSFPTA